MCCWRGCGSRNILALDRPSRYRFVSTHSGSVCSPIDATWSNASRIASRASRRASRLRSRPWWALRARARMPRASFCHATRTPTASATGTPAALADSMAAASLAHSCLRPIATLSRSAMTCFSACLMSFSRVRLGGSMLMPLLFCAFLSASSSLLVSRLAAALRRL